MQVTTDRYSRSYAVERKQTSTQTDLLSAESTVKESADPKSERRLARPISRFVGQENRKHNGGAL